MKKNIIISLIFIIVVVSAIVFYFYKKPLTNVLPNQTVISGLDNLKASLANQKELKKFSSPEEMKNFFANRPASSSGSYLDSQGFGLRTDMAATEASAPKGLGAGPANNFSTTNVQVAGVDEADIVKTDGDYIYTLNNNIISIVKAVPAAEASLVATIKLEGQGQELYITKDKLVVFGYDQSANDLAAKMMWRPNSYIFLSVYDISDKTKPSVLKNFKLEGSYTTSRLIGERLYFISTTYNFYPASDFILPKVLLDDKVISSEQTSASYIYPEVYYVDTNSAYNATTVALLSLDELNKPFLSQVYMMPSGESTYVSTDNLYLTYTKYLSEYQLRMSVARDFMFSRLPEADRTKINKIEAIDSTILSDDEKAGKVNQVIDNYFARLEETERMNLIKQLDDEFTQRYQSVYKELEKTVIHKINLADGKLTYQTSAEVSGHVLNQFSMDEYKGYFRLATTRSQSWIMPFAATFRGAMPTTEVEASYNNVYTLDDKLAVVSSIENLAPGERIYAVRFVGERGYVVTFKQTDPLFVLDFKDPAKPILAGQLKIPGFSSYLHPYKENILIGLGKEVLDKGEQGIEVQGLKISLFDVSDAANPKEINSLALGGRGSDSSVLFDHKAFLLVPDKDLIAFPMSLTKPGSTNYMTDFQGLGVFKIEADKIVEAGRISNLSTTEQGDIVFDNAKMILRSLYINDYLYAMSPALININQLADLSSVKTINLSSSDLPKQEPDSPILYEKVR